MTTPLPHSFPAMAALPAVLTKSSSMSFSRPDHATGRGGEHLYALSLYFQVPNPDVGAVVTVIAASAAAIVADLVRSIVIDIVLKEAGQARLALDRQCERDDCLGLRVDRDRKAQ